MSNQDRIEANRRAALRNIFSPEPGIEAPETRIIADLTKIPDPDPTDVRAPDHTDRPEEDDDGAS